MSSTSHAEAADESATTAAASGEKRETLSSVAQAEAAAEPGATAAVPPKKQKAKSSTAHAEAAAESAATATASGKKQNTGVQAEAAAAAEEDPVSGSEDEKDLTKYQLATITPPVQNLNDIFEDTFACDACGLMFPMTKVLSLAVLAVIDTW